ncbi:hypothetical protein [Kitasatospora sp. NPDC057500]|uniref:hypothetical protein n=1 Tax=Kitasatospora sp. NPDC057500 TaxID=3346151 RepID=UPI00368A1EFD
MPLLERGVAALTVMGFRVRRTPLMGGGRPEPPLPHGVRATVDVATVDVATVDVLAPLPRGTASDRDPAVTRGPTSG